MTDATKNRLKTIFREYRRMTPKLRSELRKMGFTVENGGKHIIIRYDTEKTALSMTSSDKRSGLNMAMQLARIKKEHDRPSPDRNARNNDTNDMEY